MNSKLIQSLDPKQFENELNAYLESNSHFPLFDIKFNATMNEGNIHYSALIIFK